MCVLSGKYLLGKQSFAMMLFKNIDFFLSFLQLDLQFIPSRCDTGKVERAQGRPWRILGSPTPPGAVVEEAADACARSLHELWNLRFSRTKMDGGAYGGGKAGAPFDPIAFVQRPQVILRAICLVSRHRESRRRDRFRASIRGVRSRRQRRRRRCRGCVRKRERRGERARSLDADGHWF